MLKVTAAEDEGAAVENNAGDGVEKCYFQTLVRKRAARRGSTLPLLTNLISRELRSNLPQFGEKTPARDGKQITKKNKG